MGILEDLQAKEPETRTVEFCMDHGLAERLAEARYERDRTRREAGRKHVDERAAQEAEAAAEDAERVYLDLVEEVRGKTIRFVLAAVDPTTFDELKAKHRPTEKQRTDARKNNTDVPEWNIDTFPPALVAAACVKVTGPSGEHDGLSLEEAQTIWSSPNWNSAERAELGNAAMAAYLTRTRLDLPQSRLVHDASLKAEMDYCGPVGLPHSQFLGWSDEDRRKALEWQADKADLCGQCGQRRSDWFDETGRELLDPPPYEVMEYIGCPGCMELGMYKEDNKNEKQKPGTYYGFRRVRIEED